MKRAARRTDPPETAAKFDNLRLLRTLGGLIVCLTGSAIALISVWRHGSTDTRLVGIGLLVALIGAGAVDYTVILNRFLRNTRRRR